MRYHYEKPDPDPWPDPVSIPTAGVAVAWWVHGFQTEPDEDTHWTGMENRTSMLVCTMVGDDAHHLYDPEDIKPLADGAFCGVCGQIGCTHDGR